MLSVKSGPNLWDVLGRCAAVVATAVTIAVATFVKPIAAKKENEIQTHPQKPMCRELTHMPFQKCPRWWKWDGRLKWRQRLYRRVEVGLEWIQTRSVLWTTLLMTIFAHIYDVFFLPAAIRQMTWLHAGPNSRRMMAYVDKVDEVWSVSVAIGEFIQRHFATWCKLVIDRLLPLLSYWMGFDCRPQAMFGLSWWNTGMNINLLNDLLLKKGKRWGFDYSILTESYQTRTRSERVFWKSFGPSSFKCCSLRLKPEGGLHWGVFY